MSSNSLQTYVLYALPLHLRPSVSLKGLTTGKLARPSGFKDRIYLTDIGECCLTISQKLLPEFKFKLVSNEGYYPWKLKLKGDQFRLLLESRIYGDTSWQSAVQLKFRCTQQLVTQFAKLLVETLHRMPYESYYWTPNDWTKFESVCKLTYQELVMRWKNVI